MQTTQSIAQQLQLARGGRMTYREIADRSGIHMNTVEQILNGKNQNPTVDTIGKIARTLNAKITLGGSNGFV